MTDDRSSREHRVESGTADVERFRQKFEGSNNKYAQSPARLRGKPAKKPGAIDKLRARANRTRRTLLIWGVGNPAKDSPDKKRITYKVRGGKLTAVDKDGNVVMEGKESGLSKYNGLTLKGEPNEKGDIELKGSWWNRLKLKRGNSFLTPRQRREAAIERVEGFGHGLMGFFIPKSNKVESAKGDKDSKVRDILKMRGRRNQRDRGRNLEHGKDH